MTGWNAVERVKSEDGITRVDYKQLFGIDIGVVENPNFITDPKWFTTHYTDMGDFYLIPYNYDWVYAERKLSKPFYGCEANGQALNVVEDEEFCGKILEGFAQSPINDGDNWYECMCHKDLPRPYILNSHITSCNVLHRYYKKTGNTKALSLYKLGVKRLESEIDYFTKPHGTLYQKINNAFKPHSRHPNYAIILSILAESADSKKLKSVAEHWKKDV